MLVTTFIHLSLVYITSHLSTLLLTQLNYSKSLETSARSRPFNMSSAGSSQNDWSMAASYQSEDQSFSFGSATESEESSYFEVPSNHPNSYQSSVDSGLQPPGTTTCVGRDDIHCTHVHGREHCPLHSREGRGTEASSSGDRDDTSYRSSAQEQDMLELPIARENSEHQYLFASPAMERYLNDEQRHEKIALGYSSLE